MTMKHSDGVAGNPARNQGQCRPAALGSDHPHRFEGSKIRSPRGETVPSPREISILKADKLQPRTLRGRCSQQRVGAKLDGAWRRDAAADVSCWCCCWCWCFCLTDLDPRGLRSSSSQQPNRTSQLPSRVLAGSTKHEEVLVPRSVLSLLLESSPLSNLAATQAS
ncbi:hypothetical protein L207DRAFT_526503 [Hyaloscypha variabilis F]|uniref:Uncharacterized protein n=1 Tax=Hyaloscypha variabilis (strain UAMH 11265 / GT02V1 / F) TaxID=1149755 RepID=A0A2J6RXT3_HYAVF|nr:hypothetical protein L207DRAFT_526503 [Hyaloscypha variabilis F]